MNIVGVQMNIAWEDKQANFAKVRSLLEGAAVAANSLIVLPEMFATGYSMNTSHIAEATGGETERFLQQVARRHRTYVIGGLARQAGQGKARNEAVVFDDQGGEVARYCKLHPFSFAKETDHYEPGREIVTFAWGDFTVGLFICYDLRFPEVFRAAVGRGVDLFVVIACWPAPRQGHWPTLLKARAIENQAYVVGVNRRGCDPHLTYAGHSTVIDPRGTVLAESDDQEGLLLACVDHGAVREYRHAFPCLRDRRSDFGTGNQSIASSRGPLP